MVVQSASAYIPTDWRHTLDQSTSLPEETSGAALFADVSGFTPLTEALTHSLGLRQGADQLSRHLNQVYDALIAQVDLFGGSVVSFAGDAITCWFSEELPEGSTSSPTLRAAACALEIQRTMQQLATVPIPGGDPVSLAVKVAIAAGQAKRFVVGDPSIQLMAALAGETLARMAAGEHLAQRGEVILDSQTVQDLGENAKVAEWRADDETGTRFAVLSSLNQMASPSPWPISPQESLTEHLVKPWLLAPVYERLQTGLGEFLTELRPAMVLFLKFRGIDFDGDKSAGEKLDAYIRWVQGVLSLYRGTLLQLTIGDKGSYIYAVWGAPIAHEDDARRALAASLDLAAPPAELGFIRDVQIGVNQGTMRTGAYGGTTRRTYGVLGDDVNMAARLMQHAAPGEVLVSQRVQEQVAETFNWETMMPIQVKGKSQPVPLARLVGKVRAPGTGMGYLGTYTGPLVGRNFELSQLLSALEGASSKNGQILRLEGPTGVGKSHLAAEFGRQAIAQEVRVCVGTCYSTAQHIAYSAWRPIFCNLLGLDDGSPESKPPLDTDSVISRQAAQVESAVERVNPDWRIRLPLLGDLLELPIPDNPTTAAFDPRLRQAALFTLAIELIEAYSRQQTLLLLIEDAHWMDEASSGLTMALGRVLSQMPVMLVLVQRPTVDVDAPLLSNISQVVGYQEMSLGELPATEIGMLVAHRLEGCPPSEWQTVVSPLALSLVQAQAQGSPFYAEEMVDALRETERLFCQDGVWTLSDSLINALREAKCLTTITSTGELRLDDNAQLSAVSIDVPDSVHGTVLSRLDRLPEPHKLTLKVASVIGRQFQYPVLARAHPARPEENALAAQHELLTERNFVQRVPLLRATFAFKHNLSQEVVYKTLPERQRCELHQSVGTVLEVYQPEGSFQPEPVEQLAYHFGRGGDEVRDKSMMYLGKAAQKAQREYANETALSYYEQALSLEERWEWRRGQIEVLHTLGRREEEEGALGTLETLPNAPAYDIGYLWGQYFETIGEYARAQEAIERALHASQESKDRLGEANSLAQLGLIARRQGDYEEAKRWYQQALSRLQETKSHSPQEALSLAKALNGLGIVHRQQGEFSEATACYQHALELSQSIGNRKGESEALNSLGTVAHYQRDFGQAIDHYSRALQIARAIGDRAGGGTTLFNLAMGIKETGEYGRAEAYLSEALSIQQAVGNKWEEVNVYNGLGILYQELGNLSQANECLSQGLQLSQQIGDEAGQAYLLANLALVARDQGDLEIAEELLNKGHALADAQDDRYLVSIFASYQSTVSLELAKFEQAIAQSETALKLRQEIDLLLFTADDLANLAAAHLALDRLEDALDYAQQALTILEECGGEGPEFPQRDYFLCYQILKAADRHDEARDALQAALDLVMKQAAKIGDPALRQSFLEQVPINRQITGE
jgi:predicted ATPase/class 3 adenylate cyclase